MLSIWRIRITKRRNDKPDSFQAVAAAKQIADNMDVYMQEKYGNKSAE